MQHPEIIKKLEAELVKAINEDDKPFLSIDRASKLLGIDNRSLRVAIANGTCPFGYGGAHQKTGSRFGRVSKLALYQFLTNGKGLSTERIEVEMEKRGLRIADK